MTLTSIFDVLPSDRFEQMEQNVIEALDQLIERSGYLGMVGTGDHQKVQHVLNSIPAYDFEWEHTYGTLFGLLSALSLADADEVGYRAEILTTDLHNWLKEATE